MNPRALIFDCDGVLADTEKDGHRVAFNQVFAEYDLPLDWTVSAYGSLLSVGGGKERMRRALTADVLQAAGYSSDPAEVDELVARLHARKSAVYQELVSAGQLDARTGVARLAREALERGWRVGVASTSAHDSVAAVVAHVFPPEVGLQLRVFAGDIVPNKKPAPDIYLAAAEGLGVDVSQCVAVEDSAIGCAAAVSAGIACVVTESEYTMGESFHGAALVLSELGDPGMTAAKVLGDPLAISPQGWVTVDHLESILDRRSSSEKGVGQR